MRKAIIFLVFIIGCSNSPDLTTNTTTTTTVATAGNKSKTIQVVDSVKPKQQSKTDYKNFNEALQNADKVIKLSLFGQSLDDGGKAKHLPAQLGTLVNLKVLEIQCLENLEDLPEEIGNLKSLDTLNMDEGNGCQMNVAIPASIGKLSNLKVLDLYGALDYRFLKDDKISDEQRKQKELPKTIVNLVNLEVLYLGRNGLKAVPSQVYSLRRLKVLNLDFDDINEIGDSISNLTNLKELSLIGDSISNLPESLKMFKGLKVVMDNYNQKPADQQRLKEKFPNINFEFDDPE